MMTFRDGVSFSSAFALIVVLGILKFVVRLYKARIRIAGLRKKGLVGHLGKSMITRGCDR